MQFLSDGDFKGFESVVERKPCGDITQNLNVSDMSSNEWDLGYKSEE